MHTVANPHSPPDYWSDAHGRLVPDELIKTIVAYARQQLDRAAHQGRS